MDSYKNFSYSPNPRAYEHKVNKAQKNQSYHLKNLFTDLSQLSKELKEISTIYTKENSRRDLSLINNTHLSKRGRENSHLELRQSRLDIEKPHFDQLYSNKTHNYGRDLNISTPQINKNDFNDSFNSPLPSYGDANNVSAVLPEHKFEFEVNGGARFSPKNNDEDTIEQHLSKDNNNILDHEIAKATPVQEKKEFNRT
mmetsp:Transcript_23169/g.20069  ORF Transcript_23169/g.20069 Transcript_23169/m.20069 type:complete len:198 (-) Transcript_23169:39-632(-)|eukprot:CAMPEP_0114584824 /NCGR_PEP_ID=MMETSP0125-20121206/8456_1 /TAXON_ID=485358 ORGANISM="Aristerostoma sp., Strain ATCC 50986" /NCGR_SAMPLE_ID=MMETSP0125 /ASSEMBLY_ACC=CAM_ASM_000245 /LENGTH=197 /DNA_ID=CAMNT_0001779465 /DNA_START=84 /DNA_END=677 /DNA_ORIENTATION=-